ncbi:MAG: XrtA/PEP-CTERM system TPR-repeat protein PrsT [Candidatus Thiodiazotropha endolucinida]
MTRAVNNVRQLNLWALLSVIVLQFMLSACTVGKDDSEALASAKTSYENGNYSKAIIELKQILQNNSANTDARQLLARSYLKKSDGISAEKEIKTVLSDKSPTADVQLILMSSWELQGKHKEIVEAYEKGGFDNIEPMRVWGVVSHSYLSVEEMEKGTVLAEKMLEKDTESVTALRSLAKAASMRNDDTEALEYLQRALEIDKKDYKVWRDLGSLHVKLEDHGKAVELLKGALSLIDEDDPKQDAYIIKVNLTHLFFHLKRLDESSVYIRELEAQYKKNPYVAYLSGLYDYLKQDYESAVTKLSQAHSVMPNHLPTTLLLGALHFSENNLEQANILLTRYVNQVPTHLQARKLLGEIKLRLDKPKEALALLESGGADSNDDQILTMIGLAASQSGEYSKGIEFLKKAAHVNPSDTRIREELARLYINHGSVDEAISELEDEWEGESSNRDTLLILSYIKKQDFDSARKLSDQLLTREGERPGDLYLRAMIELNSGNRNYARRYFADAVSKSAEFIPGQLALARMDLEDGRLMAGSDRLNLVLAREPGNVNAMMLLAQISERSGSQKEALAWLEKAVETGKDSWLPRVILARYYLRRKQPDKAAVYLDDKQLRQSNNPAIISLLALIDQQTGHYNQAESTIKKLLDDNPDSEMAYLQLADLQTKRGDLEAARTTLQRLDRKIPLTIKGKLLRYKLELQDRNYQQVETIIEQLLDKDKTRLVGVTLQANYHEARGDIVKAINTLKAHATPKSPFILIQQLSDLYIKNKDSMSAINLLTSWKRSHKNNQQVQLALAIVYQTMGKMNAALKLYSDLLEVNPRNIVALNNSALLNFDRDPQKALDQAKLAYEISGNATQSVVDTYAWLTHKSGDTATALKILSPIMDTASDPSILYHYAVMLVESDNVKAAKEVLVTLSKDHADFPESEEAKKLLSEISQIKG